MLTFFKLIHWTGKLRKSSREQERTASEHMGSIRELSKKQNLVKKANFTGFFKP